MARIGLNEEFMWFEMIMKGLQAQCHDKFSVYAVWDLSAKRLLLTWTGVKIDTKYRGLLEDTLWINKIKGSYTIDDYSAIFNFTKITASLHRHLEQSCELLNKQFSSH